MKVKRDGMEAKVEIARDPKLVKRFNLVSICCLKIPDSAGKIGNCNFDFHSNGWNELKCAFALHTFLSIDLISNILLRRLIKIYI